MCGMRAPAHRLHGSFNTVYERPAGALVVIRGRVRGLSRQTRVQYDVERKNEEEVEGGRPGGVGGVGGVGICRGLMEWCIHGVVGSETCWA